jgi:hypothetical protein
MRASWETAARRMIDLLMEGILLNLGRWSNDMDQVILGEDTRRVVIKLLKCRGFSMSLLSYDMACFSEGCRGRICMRSCYVVNGRLTRHCALQHLQAACVGLTDDGIVHVGFLGAFECFVLP